jgi:hypothetical protein
MREAGMRSRLIVLGVVALFAAGCGAGPTSRPVTDTTEAGRLARITIPASADGLVCSTDHGTSRGLPAPDYAVWGRLDIPAEDLSVALAGMPKDSKLEPFHDLSHFPADRIAEPWWQPRQLHNPREACWAAPGFSFNLLFGETEREGVLTVYFFNNSM